MNSPITVTRIRRHAFMAVVAVGNSLILGACTLLALWLFGGTAAIKFYKLLPISMALIGLSIPMILIVVEKQAPHRPSDNSQQNGISPMMKSALVWVGICSVAILLFLNWK